MLILTRRLGETLVIGDDIRITPLGIKGNQIRIGIDAPKSVPVHREEIYQRIQVEKDEGGEGKLVPGLALNEAIEKEKPTRQVHITNRTRRPMLSMDHQNDINERELESETVEDNRGNH